MFGSHFPWLGIDEFPDTRVNILANQHFTNFTTATFVAVVNDAGYILSL